MDKISPERRSENMRRIRSTGMKPEMAVRKLSHRLGYRYRLHRRDMPGKPDLVFVSRRKVIFVHGCYWHGHGCAVGGTGAKSNTEYWGPKISRNKERDRQAIDALKNGGWDVLVIWECETRDSGSVEKAVKSFLGPIQS